MPGWPGGLGNRLQDGRAVVDNGLGDRLQNWWNNTTFFKPAYDELMGGLTAPGDVMSGAQPTMAADPQTGEFHTDPRLADRASALAGAVTLGAGAVPAEENALRMGIKAYHGSPHDFERFDSSKIGTGEGAQAYGHGMYLAESEKVAEQYRKNLSYKQVKRDFLDALPEDADFADVTSLIGKGHFSPYQERVINALKADDWLGFDYPSQAISAAYRELDNFDPSPELRDAIKQSGRMYEVDIAADPEHFLDWDKPLSEQSPQVREKLGIDDSWMANDELSRDVYEKGKGWFDPRRPSADQKASENWENLWRRLRPGEEIPDMPANNAPNVSGAAFLKSSPGVEQHLNEAGIPGIRYLDQGSRGPATIYNVGSPRADFGPYSPYTNRADAEEQLKLLRRMGETDAEIKEQVQPQSRNLVIFPGNEHLIAILKKYGLPISAAGLAALSQLHPQEAQAQPLGDRLQRGSR